MRGNDISMIFADPMSALNPLHTVGNQIAEVIELHHSGLSHDEIEKKVDEMMELVGIPAERKSEYPISFLAACVSVLLSLWLFPAIQDFFWQTSQLRHWMLPFRPRY